MITNLVSQSLAGFAAAVTLKPTKQEEDFTVLENHAVGYISQAEITALTAYANKLDIDAPIPDSRTLMRQALLQTIQDGYALGVLHGYEDHAKFSAATDLVLFASNDLDAGIRILDRDLSQDIVRQPKTLDRYTRQLDTIQQQVVDSGRDDLGGTLEDLNRKLNNARTKANLDPLRRGLIKGIARGNEARDSINNSDTILQRAIEEKVKYLKTQRDGIGQTPPIVLPDDKEFFQWYERYRVQPIVQRYQNKTNANGDDARKIIVEYTEEINKTSATGLLKKQFQQRVLKRLLPIEQDTNNDPSIAQDRLRTSPLGRVQRVVITELATAYNIGRLRAFIESGVEYVTISNDRERGNNPCSFCEDAAALSVDNPIRISDILVRGDMKQYRTPIKSPSNLRYLVFHPFCKCYYVPSDQRDDPDTVKSVPVVDQPTEQSVLKFILGAGLGIGLIYLAFALTNRKLVQKVLQETTDIVPAPVTALRVDPVAPPTSLIDDIVADNRPRQLPPSVRPAINLEPSAFDNLPFAVRERIRPIALDPALPEIEKNTQVFEILVNAEVRINPGLARIGQPDRRSINEIKKAQRLALSNIFGALDRDYQRNVDVYTAKLQAVSRKIQPLDNPNIPDIKTLKEVTIQERELRSISNVFLKPAIAKRDKIVDRLAASMQKVVARTTNVARDTDYLDELESYMTRLDNQRRLQETAQGTYIKDAARRLQNIKQSITEDLTFYGARLDAMSPEIDDLIVNLQAGVSVPNAREVYTRYLDEIVKYTEIDGNVKKYQRKVQRLRSLIPPADYKRYQGLATFGKYS